MFYERVSDFFEVEGDFEENRPCDNCGAEPGTDAYDNFHDSVNCWR